MLVLLAGCSKESPPPVQSESPPAKPAAGEPVKRDDRPVIVTFGDSLSAGFGVEAGFAYPDYLQKELDAAGYKYRVANEGLSGDTTGGGVGRVESVIALKPKIVILELGANDGLRGIPVSTTRENLDSIIGTLKKSGAEVLLAGITLPRNYGEEYIREFDRIFPELARKHNVKLLPFLLEGVALDKRLMQSDALHPTVDGNRMVARNVFRALRPLLVKR